MTIEEQLKQFIVIKYGTVRNFCEQTNIPQSTLSTIFKRGIQRTSIDLIFKICDELAISADAIAEGKIIPKDTFESKEYTEYDYIFDQMLIDGKKLNDYESWNMKRAFHDQADRIRETRARFEPDFEYYDTPKGKFAIDKNSGRRFYVAPNDTFIPFNDPKRINKIIEEFNKQEENE